MNGLFKSSFDPITRDHLNLASKIRKQKQLDHIYFYVEDKEEATYLYRKEMVKIMIDSYRKFSLIEDISDSDEYYLITDSCENSSIEAKNGNFEKIPKYLRSYILDKGLYCEDIIKAKLKEKRYLHCLSVAQLSKEIAESNHLDSNKAYRIGIFHDIAKNLSKEENEFYISINDVYENDYPLAVWHQYIGYYLLKHYYCWKDKEALKAIRHHCLGDDNSVYSKIIFIADKLDPSRGYDSSKEIALAKKDLNKGFETVKQQNAEYLENKGVNK